VRLPDLPGGTYQVVALTVAGADAVKDVSAPLRVTVRHGTYKRIGL
jgi:hypothetical protein